MQESTQRGSQNLIIRKMAPLLKQQEKLTKMAVSLIKLSAGINKRILKIAKIKWAIKAKGLGSFDASEGFCHISIGILSHISVQGLSISSICFGNLNLLIISFVLFLLFTSSGAQK